MTIETDLVAGEGPVNPSKTKGKDDDLVLDLEMAKAQKRYCVDFIMRRCNKTHCAKNHTDLVRFKRCGCCMHNFFGQCWHG